MRVLIATAATVTLAAAAAAGIALQHPPRPKAEQSGPAPVDAVAVSDAVPGLVWRSGSVTLRLTDQPCASDEMTRALEPEGTTQARAYEVVQGSKRYSGCWTKDVGGDVVTIEPGREIGSIPIAWFHAGG